MGEGTSSMDETKNGGTLLPPSGSEEVGPAAASLSCWSSGVRAALLHLDPDV